MANTDRILVIEDDPTLCKTLLFNLELDGYQTDFVYSAEDALKRPLDQYSLILLDVMMGPKGGFALARQLKENPATAQIPIIFCTLRNNDEDILRRLGIGNEDYIYKPYTLRNVLARLKTLLRNNQTESAEMAAENPVIRAYGIEIDTRMKRCTVDGKEVKLVKKEFEILSLLMSHPGQVFTREAILNRVWPEQVVVLETTVNVNITRLRQKLSPYGGHIITRQGYGYGFD